MSTTILELPTISFVTETTNTADLLDTIVGFTLNSQLIDLTGIYFQSHIREKAEGIKVLLDANTQNGYLVNGGPNGTISWNVPLAIMKTILPGSYVTDMIAQADGHIIAVAQKCTFTVTQGVTRT